MLKIGLTGGIASGKSTICQLFSSYDIPIIDADIIARQIVEPDQPAFQQVVQKFGSEIVQQDGYLNRSFLRQLIFSNPDAKIQLEKILHPKISLELQRQSDALDTAYCILDIPLLIESNLQDSVERILVIDISPEKQLERLCQRDKISVEDAQLIITNQCSQQQRLAVADDVIDNNKSPDAVANLIFDLHQKYLTIANSTTSSCQRSDSHGQ